MKKSLIIAVNGLFGVLAVYADAKNHSSICRIVERDGVGCVAFSQKISQPFVSNDYVYTVLFGQSGKKLLKEPFCLFDRLLFRRRYGGRVKRSKYVPKKIGEANTGARGFAGTKSLGWRKHERQQA